GRASGTTLYMTMLGAFALLLHRLTGQDDLVIGSPVAGRPRAELRGLIGFFVNTVALRFRVDAGASAAGWLRHVRDVALAAFANDAPFNQVVQAVEPPRIAGRHPLFQAWFNLDVDSDAGALRLGDVAADLIDEVVDAPTQVDLSLVIQQRRGELTLKWLYDERLFDRERIAAMALQLEHLLGELAAGPERAVRDASLVPPAHAALLPDPHARIDRPSYPPVTQLVRSWAERTPDHPAIAWGAETWTYAQLDERTRAIGAALRGLGDGAVAISGPPSPGLIAGLIGTLRSGRVVVPIDPALPAARRARMIAEAGVTTLVEVADAAGGDAILIDPRTGACSAGPDGFAGGAGACPREIDEPVADRAAYVFYTSGSTGTPKGILGTRDGIAQLVAWQRETFAVGPADRVSQLTRLSFDAILRDVFLPLTSGATLCIPEDADRDAPLAWLAAARVTIAHGVPSLVEHWLRVDDAASRLPHLRLAFLSGEPLGSDLVRRWRLAAPDCELVNLYGPTETTMIRCCYRVPAEPLDGPQSAGWALPESAALVEGPGGRRCGIGETGEIVLRTAFATLGYLGAPSEQAARFERSADGITRYRTGDRGRYRLDGSLDVLGRADRQIKLRGVRIELGEVEAALRHAGAAQAVALVTDGAATDRRLVAFVVPGPAPQPTAAELHSRLAAELPEWAVPAAITEIAAIPLTPSGKTDGAALLARLAPVPSVARAPAETATQRLVLAQFTQLLGAEVGIHDNFFERGGHSLLAAQLVTRLRRATGQAIALRMVFDQ
ncbi:MAG TPA: amino acid adenylation domain-containing protein, partial [Kofleriaceae bacterium]|nr:amino acid adenylation domain-containing protein [Kofleriaceae bacterium]